MIITVTLNAAIDKSLSVPNFRLGRRHRTVEQTTMPGGKGVNVARTLKTLGQPVIATGFAGGATGTRIVEQLTEESILNDFVRIREESRTNTAVLDPTNGEQTEINERGPHVSPAEVELFQDKLLYLARGADIVVFAGSLPRGVEPGVYAVLIRELRKLGVTTIIDADGEPMRLAVRAEPDVISPNVLEAEELVGHEFNDEEDRAIAVRELVQLGPKEAIMTLPDGCVASILEEHGSGPGVLHRVWIEEREPVAPVGSGDAFLAGVVAARYSGEPPAECLRFGVACGAESTQRLGRRPHRPARGRAPAVRDGRAAPGAAGRGAVGRPPRPGRSRPAGHARVRALRSRSSSRPPATLGCTDGDRDRPREEGPPRLWLRRRRDRALAAHARPRRRRHLLEARRLPLRAAAARLGDGRRRLARDGAGSSASSAAWPS